MRLAVRCLIVFVRKIVQCKSGIILENIALRQQLVVLKRTKPRPLIKTGDRIFWVLISKIWRDWKGALILVKPETVIRWHRKGFKMFWKWNSRHGNKGRNAIHSEIKKLILSMADANPLWGAPRIHGELLKLGIDVSEKTVSNLIGKFRPKPPSQSWKTFLKNHMHNTFSVDFFTLPTINFKILYVFIILSHNRRKIVHINVTAHPGAQWTAQQIVQACPWETAPKYLIRDRDGIYGSIFKNRVKRMGIHQVVTAPQSPWQNPYTERVIGSIRRECLNHVIVLSESHLKRILSSYVDYYNNDRTHLGINKDTPDKRPIQPKPINAKLLALPRVGGLHHRYEWKAVA